MGLVKKAVPLVLLLVDDVLLSCFTNNACLLHLSAAQPGVDNPIHFMPWSLVLLVLGDLWAHYVAYAMHSCLCVTALLSAALFAARSTAMRSCNCP